MTENEFIKALAKLAEDLAQDARYIEFHNFTNNTDRQTTFVQSNSAVSYQNASDRLFNLIADYCATKKQSYAYSPKMNWLIQQKKQRVLSLETSSQKR